MSNGSNPGVSPPRSADVANAAEGPLTPEALASQGLSGEAPLDPATEKELWAGRSSWRAIYPTLLLWALVMSVAATAAHMLVQNAMVTWTVLGIGAAVLVIMLARTAWGIWSASYRLTSQRLIVRRGIFSQTVDQTELLRVDDVRMRQTLLQRMLGIGEVEMLSNDISDKKLAIHDVENPEQIAEHIRRYTRTVQKRTVFMEQM